MSKTQKLNPNAKEFVPTHIGKTGKKVEVDPERTGNSVPGSNPVIQVLVSVNMQAVYSACASFCQIALTRGYPIGDAAGAIIALQADAIQAMNNKIPAYSSATQLWWDFRDSLLPCAVKTKKGNYNFGWISSTLQPLTGGTGGYTNYYTTNGSLTNGLAQLVVSTQSVPDIASTLNTFFTYIATKDTPLVDFSQRFVRYKDDPSIFAQKMNRVNTPTPHQVDGQPLHSVVSLEVPIRSYWAMMGIAGTQDSRFTKYTRQCEGGAAAVIATEYFIRNRMGDKTERHAIRPSYFNFYFKFVDMDAILIALFNQLVYANTIQITASQEPYFDQNFDAVGFCLYVINSAMNMRGTEVAAPIGLSFIGVPLVIGTPTTSVGQSTSNQLPAWYVESLRSLMLTIYGVDYIYPVISIGNQTIQTLANMFPQFNWTNWGGTNLNLQTGTIGSTVVSLVPTMYDALRSAFDTISQNIGQASTIISVYQTTGVHPWSLMGYTVQYYNANSSELKRALVQNLVRKCKIKPSSVDIMTDKLIEGDIQAVTTTTGTVFSTVGFPKSYYIDQNLILPVLYANTFADDTQTYGYANHYSSITSSGGTNTPAAQASTNATTLTKTANNSSGGEVMQAIDHRATLGVGGAFSSIFGGKAGAVVDGLVDSLGPIAQAINFGVGGLVDMFK